MRAEYDTQANAISIEIAEVDRAEKGDEGHERAVVAVAAGRAVEVQVLYPDLGVDEPIRMASERYGLDREALIAAARSALAAPDRRVVVDVGLRQ